MRVSKEHARINTRFVTKRFQWVELTLRTKNCRPPGQTRTFSPGLPRAEPQALPDAAKVVPGPRGRDMRQKWPQPAFAVENLIQSTPPLTLIILICSLSHRTLTKFVSSYNPTAARIQARDCPGIGVPSLQTLCVFYSHQPARVFFAFCVFQSLIWALAWLGGVQRLTSACYSYSYFWSCDCSPPLIKLSPRNC